jgi:Ca2+-binding RTX toxin-like protein
LQIFARKLINWNTTMFNTLTPVQKSTPLYEGSSYTITVFEWAGTDLDDMVYGHGNHRNRIFGAEGDDYLFAGKGTGNDTLYGGLGDDTLQAGFSGSVLDGGAGADIMIGGQGADTFYVDHPDDVVIEGAVPYVSFSSDKIIASIDYSLDGTNIEKLYLAGSAIIGQAGRLTSLISGNDENNILLATDRPGVTHSLSLYGGAGDDTLKGGLGNDIISGGDGADVLMGGRGSDTYIISDADDTIVERLSWATGGVENRVWAHDVDFSIEGMAIRDINISGDGYRATGNAFSNHLRSYSDDTILDGGRGIDTLDGGSGDNTYIIRHRLDEIIEDGFRQNRDRGGHDQIEAHVSYKITNGVEDIFLQDVISKLGNLVNNMTAIGNGWDNIIAGNSTDNNLNGRGGSDTLTGGDGADRFIFSDELSERNIDLITDFISGEDQIIIKGDVIDMDPGVMDEQAFHLGTEATTSSHRLVFDGTTLSYDSDGSGAGAAIDITTLDGAPTLTVDDILIV